MRTILALTALATVGLAACEMPAASSSEASGTAPAAETPSSAPGTATPAPAAELGGVDLNGDVSVLGTEPFWGVNLAGANMTYSGVDTPEQVAPRPTPSVSSNVASWTTTTSAGQPLVVMVVATECSDGMSDRTYPLHAYVLINDVLLVGCAASTAWIRAAGDGG